MKRKLDVVVFTHNHAPFVEQTLASILSQKTEFEFGIRIHDDASTDDTIAVVRSALAGTDIPYEVTQATTNRFAEGTSFYHEFIAASKAEYVAILDGDDYWIDEDKLQSQVDLLDREPTAALAHHPVLELVGEDLTPTDWPPADVRVDLMPGSRLSAQNVISSSSVVIRRSMFPTTMPVGYNELGVGDYPMWALASAGHDIAFIDRPMTAYRVHHNNLYASLDRDRRMDRELEARIYISNHVPEEFRADWRAGIVFALTYLLRGELAAKSTLR